MTTKTKVPANQTNRIIVKYSIINTLAFVVYFFVMKALGLAQVNELRFINYVLFAFIASFEMNELKRVGDNRVHYLQGLMVVFVTGMLAFLAFAAFVLVYSFIDPFFKATIAEVMPGSVIMGNFAAPFLIFAEGIGISAILSLCLMQFFKQYSKRREILPNSNTFTHAKP